MADDFAVTVSAGSLRADPADGFVVPHAWTDAGVVVAAPGTGAHLLHTAVATCVLNDVYREAQGSGLDVAGVAVVARGGFDAAWVSTGIAYDVEVDSPADHATVQALLARVDEVAEIPKTLRAGVRVGRG
ncbi:OsmC family protein [Nocardioides sp.]|uniref:OsmC family protein n=1 Tax=Nocardioides sp. TaxID=35761 RepID=UPI0035612E83